MAGFYRKIGKFFLILPILFNLSGCVYLVVGGIGALGGYIVSPDTIEGITATDSKEVFDKALQVVSILGLVTDQQKESGVIRAKIGASKLYIDITSINSTTTKISIKARKAFLPKISLAQDVYVKIMSQLGE